MTEKLLCTVMSASCVICIQNKVEHGEILPYMNVPCNAVTNWLDKISLHRHFNANVKAGD